MSDDIGSCYSCGGPLEPESSSSHEMLHRGVIVNGITKWRCLDCDGFEVEYPCLGPLCDLLKENPEAKEVTWTGKEWKIED